MSITIASFLLAALPVFGQTGAIRGAIRDANGQPVGGALVHLVKYDNPRAQFRVMSAKTGVYFHAGLPLGVYRVAVLINGSEAGAYDNISPGPPNQPAVVNFDLPLSQSAPGPPTSVPRIRVGGNVQSAKLIHREPAVYPQALESQRIDGVVRLTVLIASDGSVAETNLISAPHRQLAKAASDAVRLYRYQPTLLNGQPAEVITQVDVPFVAGGTSGNSGQSPANGVLVCPPWGSKKCRISAPEVSFFRRGQQPVPIPVDPSTNSFRSETRGMLVIRFPQNTPFPSGAEVRVYAKFLVDPGQNTFTVASERLNCVVANAEIRCPVSRNAAVMEAAISVWLN